MQELSWIAESTRVWLEGGDLSTVFGFNMLVAFVGFIVGPSLIAVGVGAVKWHET
ncbi:MAG: hypothetical protein ABL883_03200 [Terricaulis sp.]